MANQVKGHPDPRKHKVTKDGMTPITRVEGRKLDRRYDTLDEKRREEVDALLEYEWPQG